jgi:hypothetical protein
MYEGDQKPIVMPQYLDRESLRGFVTKYKILPAILSADVLLAAFFIGSSVLLVYFPQKLIHLQPLRDFVISKGQNLAFSLSPSLLKLLTVNLF